MTPKKLTLILITLAAREVNLQLHVSGMFVGSYMKGALYVHVYMSTCVGIFCILCSTGINKEYVLVSTFTPSLAEFTFPKKTYEAFDFDISWTWLLSSRLLVIYCLLH